MAIKKKPKLEDPLTYGALCGNCAKQLGGVGVMWAVTMTAGPCPRCKKSATLIPVSDFHWPNFKKKAIWD